MLKTAKEYLVQMGLTEDVILDGEEAQSLMNHHAMLLYRGQISIQKNRQYRAIDVARKLHEIHKTFADVYLEVFQTKG